MNRHGDVRAAGPCRADGLAGALNDNLRAGNRAAHPHPVDAGMQSGQEHDRG